MTSSTLIAARQSALISGGFVAVVWLIEGLDAILPGRFEGNGVQPRSNDGLAGIVFGWIAYLVLRGVFARDVRQILLGVVVFIAYGSALWGVLPGRPGISWEGHLFGAIGGALAAW